MNPGGTRRGNRGRGAAGKIPVRWSCIYEGYSRRTICKPRKIIPDSIVYSDCWRGYNVLDISDFKHYRINHSKLFSDQKNHINGIENFWNQAKRHIRKYNGVPKENFPLFLKECEWHFNNPDPRTQLKQLKQWVLEYLY